MLENTEKMRDSSSMLNDPLSDVLKLANAQSVLVGGFTAGGSWALRFPPPDKLKFFALLKGQCWLSIHGEPPVQVKTGDVLLLSTTESYVLAGDLNAAPVDALEVFNEEVKTAAIGNGEDCIQVGGHVLLDPSSDRILADVLPPLIHVSSASPGATVLQWLLSQLLREQGGELPGSGLATTQLAQLMFLHVLRVHLAETGPLVAGWLRVVADRRLAPAVRLMHAQPGRAWELSSLAKASGMSRTTFAVKFKEAAGVAPLTYLTQWRMRLAERSLRQGGTSLATLAGDLGYSSESAFSNAFKRVTGIAPQHYRSRK
ncbi:AraC family transcriptional regulator [Paraburkholderia sp. RCC_158]|uniref:AraC family transcriptional regulator n=1 Tax=Paraburkholderia sp. RCC_158 TaxID=3239220 RepID=UPI003526B117